MNLASEQEVDSFAAIRWLQATFWQRSDLLVITQCWAPEISISMVNKFCRSDIAARRVAVALRTTFILPLVLPVISGEKFFFFGRHAHNVPLSRDFLRILLDVYGGGDQVEQSRPLPLRRS